MSITGISNPSKNTLGMMNIRGSLLMSVRIYMKLDSNIPTTINMQAIVQKSLSDDSSSAWC
jgi:hypothetical protein